MSTNSNTSLATRTQRKTTITMVATRNKRKSSLGGGASSPAAATRSSKKGKAAASPETPDEIEEVAAASPIEKDGGLDDAGTVPQPPAAAETSVGESAAPDVDATDAAIQEKHDDEQQRADEAMRADASVDQDVAPKGSDESGDVKVAVVEEEEVPSAETTTSTASQPKQQQGNDNDDRCNTSNNNNNNNNKADAKEVETKDDELNSASASQDVAAAKLKEDKSSDINSTSQQQQANQNKAAADKPATPADAPSNAAVTASSVSAVIENKGGKETVTATNSTTTTTTTTTTDKNMKGTDDKNTKGTSSKATSASTATTTATAMTTTPTTSSSSTTVLEENDQLSPLHVGRVIGKGGEMIRDLQARSGCLRIDVDQNVPHNAPRIITYRGTRQAIDFAKQLVVLLCQTEQGKEANLPLGHAVVKNVHVPSNVIGKIIGRGGEMIRKLQGESMAKIQVDHTATTAGGDRLITITGVQESVSKAEEMIAFVCANPALDSMQGLDMFLRDKAQQQYYPQGGGGGGGSGPNNYYPPYPPHQQQGQFGGGFPGGGSSATPVNISTSLVVETDLFPCPKTYMGRVIGQKGVTINDLQKRSGCDIQVNQNVPAGQDCQISIKGNRGGIEMAKQMLREIIEMGPNHPYAGGREYLYLFSYSFKHRHLTLIGFLPLLFPTPLSFSFSFSLAHTHIMNRWTNERWFWPSGWWCCFWLWRWLSTTISSVSTAIWWLPR